MYGEKAELHWIRFYMEKFITSALHLQVNSEKL